MTPSPFVASHRRASAPPDTRLYAVGDIHGRRDLLDRLLALVEADARRSSAARKLLVFLGDYIDRGDQSRQVIELLADKPARWEGFEWVCLKGNHEDALLRFLAGRPTAGALWMHNGGWPTVQSYAADLVNPFDLPALREVMIAALPAAHRGFLESLALWRVEGDYCLVHAGLRPGVALEAQDPADLLWIREDFLAWPERHGRIVVHGHTPARTPELKANRIGIDTGAFVTGRLTALVAEGAELDFLST
jgi:serine/threonine protein phosphatase 1